jgi:N6-adenosine-specific RNA methylase IME4
MTHNNPSAPRYQTIVADPPWEYDFPMKANVGTGRSNRLVDLPYPSMTIAQIAALPVVDLADDDCRLFLWTTNTHLPAAFGVVEAWGFRYRQLLVWHKTRSTPHGHIAPNRAEFMLVGRRGQPQALTRFPSSVILASPGRHSQKPDAFMDYIEGASPAPRLELFARRQRMGWDTWGNEALEHVELTS